ncbi:MAG: hypothetical protein AVDCRST_MAG87-3374, partial [uncultured Thermomicrobiales bacterium]
CAGPARSGTGTTRSLSTSSAVPDHRPDGPVGDSPACCRVP